MAAVAPSPFHEGRTLRRARQRKHLSIAEAAEATRISERFLQALEREAPIEEFPAIVYARAFLREYATYLGLDSEKLVRAFDARHEAQEAPQLVPAPVVPPPRRWPARAAAVISVGVVVTLAVMKLTTAGNTPGTRPPPQGRLPVIGRGVPTDSHQPTHPSARRIHLVIRVHAACWTEATADGKPAFTARTLQPGERVSFNAKKAAELRLGNAGGIKLVVNGKRIRTGASGQVVTLSFARRGGKVVVR
ncbi:MAG TPA: helix-turn-helix domain-containing protein [Actinomycetota bacterium]|nr:helix-turn-helix domain-containing protein [Actinomycetota bacterium]